MPSIKRALIMGTECHRIIDECICMVYFTCKDFLASANLYPSIEASFPLCI